MNTFIGGKNRWIRWDLLGLGLGGERRLWLGEAAGREGEKKKGIRIRTFPKRKTNAVLF